MTGKKVEIASAQTRPQFEAKLRELLAQEPPVEKTPWDAPTEFMNKRDLIVYVGGQPGMKEIPLPVIISSIEGADERGFVQSARLCGGEAVLVAVARCCIEGAIGCFVLDDEVPSLDGTFVATTNGAIVTVPQEHIDDFADQLDDIDVPYTALGQVGGDRIIASGEPNNVTYIDLGLSEL